MCSLFLFLLVAVLSVVAGVSSAQGPPRGWNSYDSFGCFINQQEFLDNCRAMAANMPTYKYCVMDALWYQDLNTSVFSLDAYGRPQPSPDRWPGAQGGQGFKVIADQVHAMGLLFGIHIMRGISQDAVDQRLPVLGTNVTAADIAVPSQKCPWQQRFMSVNVSMPEGRAFYASLYQQYAAWGVDFIKNDCVFGGNYVHDEIAVQSAIIQDVYRTTRHLITYSLSPGDTKGALSGAEEVNAKATYPLVNSYRVSDDDWDSWDAVSVHFDIAANFAATGIIGAPGLLGQASWPDLDMLPFGWITSPGSTKGPYRNTSLTPAEQRTQMTLWAMARSPLIFGGDMRHMDAFTLALLTNADVLAVNSNSAGNRQVLSQNGWRVWSAYTSPALSSSSSAAPAAPGVAVYAALFNTNAQAASFSLPVAALHEGSTCTVRDVWAGQDKGRLQTLTASNLGSHDVALFVLTECGNN